VIVVVVVVVVVVVSLEEGSSVTKIVGRLHGHVRVRTINNLLVKMVFVCYCRNRTEISIPECFSLVNAVDSCVDSSTQTCTLYM